MYSTLCNRIVWLHQVERANKAEAILYKSEAHGNVCAVGVETRPNKMTVPLSDQILCQTFIKPKGMYNLVTSLVQNSR